MSAAQKPESTAVARQKPTLPPDIQAKVEENRVRNAAVAAIRGTLWGRDLGGDAVRAVAQYARDNNLDAVRHIEVLGGRIYLTAEFYDERGAALVRDGLIQPDEPVYINADERLDKLAAAGDSWAKAERDERLRQRIRFNVPENAKAAVVQRMRITATGAVVVGVNWCGTGRKDPVGDAEPAKTAQTRARRRAWKQIAEVIPDYAAQVRPVEARAEAVAPVMVIERTERRALPPMGQAHGAKAHDAEYYGDGEAVIDTPPSDGEAEAPDTDARDADDPTLGLDDARPKKPSTRITD